MSDYQSVMQGNDDPGMLAQLFNQLPSPISSAEAGPMNIGRLLGRSDEWVDSLRNWRAPLMSPNNPDITTKEAFMNLEGIAKESPLLARLFRDNPRNIRGDDIKTARVHRGMPDDYIEPEDPRDRRYLLGRGNTLYYNPAADGLPPPIFDAIMSDKKIPNTNDTQYGELHKALWELINMRPFGTK